MVSIEDAARRVGVSVGTLRRWVRDGLIPHYDGNWTAPAVGHARVIQRMRDRGHSLEQIRRATDDGRLAFGFIDELMPAAGRTYTLRQASRETGLEPALISRIITALGWSPVRSRSLDEGEIMLS